MITLDLVIEMNIGYARTSTIDQVAGLEAQLKELKAVGCEKIFHEQVSSIAERFKFKPLLSLFEKGIC